MSLEYPKIETLFNRDPENMIKGTDLSTSTTTGGSAATEKEAGEEA